MLRRLLLILLLSGLGAGPAVVGRMAVDHARAESAPEAVVSGEICGSGPSGTQGHPHCDYCQIAPHSLAPGPALQSRPCWTAVHIPVPGFPRELHPVRRWTHPPANAPPVTT